MARKNRISLFLAFTALAVVLLLFWIINDARDASGPEITYSFDGIISEINGRRITLYSQIIKDGQYEDTEKVVLTDSKTIFVSGTEPQKPVGFGTLTVGQQISVETTENVNKNRQFRVDRIFLY